METVTKIRPQVQQTYNLLNQFDFSNVEAYMVNREGYSSEKVKEMKEEYIRFISLCSEHATGTNPVIMTAEVDPFWHTHILFTEDYRSMCKKIFGGNDAYLDHMPTKSDADVIALDKQYNEGTLNLYEHYFGEPDERFWPKDAMICGGKGCSCSGTGNS